MILTLEIQPLARVTTHPWTMGNRCVKYPDPTWHVCTVTLPLEIYPSFKVMTRPWVMESNCVKYPNPTWHEELWLGHAFWVCLHLDFGDITLVQGQDPSLGYGHQLYKIVSKSDMGEGSNGPDAMWTYFLGRSLRFLMLPCLLRMGTSAGAGFHRHVNCWIL